MAVFGLGRRRLRPAPVIEHRNAFGFVGENVPTLQREPRLLTTNGRNISSQLPDAMIPDARGSGAMYRRIAGERVEESLADTPAVLIAQQAAAFSAMGWRKKGSAESRPDGAPICCDA